MTLEDQRRAIVRLLTDPTYRERFYNAEEAKATEFGLTVSEFRKLRKIPPRTLDIVSEGYIDKRGEHLGSVFPRTLAILGEIHEGAWDRYVEETPFPHSEIEERETFVSYLREDLDVPENQGRFLLDLADLEQIAYEHRSSELPSYRFTDDLKPVADEKPPIHEARGDLEPSLSTGAIPPEDYPASPSSYLLIQEGDDLLLHELGPTRTGLLNACDGTHTVEDLREDYGPETEPIVKRWLRAGILRAGDGIDG